MATVATSPGTSHADTDLNHTPSTRSAVLALGALGIVYGDIGTSPLYAFKTAVQAAGGAGPDVVTGVLSLLFWSLILIVSVKYAVLIMQADNRGEGGVVAMLALLNARDAKVGSWRSVLLVLGLVGAALLYGDGAITPAISVLSAVEGLKVPAPHLAPLVLPISLAILVALFSVQWRGTAQIGRLFGPVMVVWFIVIGWLGLAAILQHPQVLAAFEPWRAAAFVAHAPPMVSFAVAGAVFLAVTGGEAMYADMGHFGRFPIRLAWFGVALPALTLNYFGQGALLLGASKALDSPFYLLAPGWGHLPLILLATAATVIASQAIISGVFSLTEQSVQLGFLPRLQVVHTASDERGQIYVPLANWLLAAATLGAVLGFRSSDALAGAYGVAVSLLMGISTLLAGLIAVKWRVPVAVVVLVNGGFLLIDLLFFSANALKIASGGWYPLAIAGGAAFLMLTWRRGAMQVEAAREKLRTPTELFLRKLGERPVHRLPGVAAYLTASETGIPPYLTQQLKHSHVLHERVILVTVVSIEDPVAAPESRVEITKLEHGLERIVLRFGFMQRLNIPRALKENAAELGLTKAMIDDMTYFVGRETVLASPHVPGMPVWREEVFVAMQRNAERSANYFCIPPGQSVEVGIEVEI